MQTPHIVIHTDRDLTPPGKRTAKVVQLRGGAHIRWYVGGKIYSTRANTPAQAAVTRNWIAAAL